jgi:hypothetical protein
MPFSSVLSRALAMTPACLATPLALAHEGHGLPGASHWHATDTLGLLLVGAVAAAAAWWLRRK